MLTFGWSETPDRLRDFAATGEPEFVRERLAFVDGERVFHVPLATRVDESVHDVDSYLRNWRDALPSTCIVLLRAGATAIGLWHDTDLVAHKAFKKYVVRGKGRAQTTHLATKGKSRYGSRLRLQNAQRQLEETNERLIEWWSAHGAAEHVLYAAPVRMWPDLFRVEPRPPFDRTTAVRIPRHVHTPTFEELQRVRRFSLRGSVE